MFVRFSTIVETAAPQRGPIWGGLHLAELVFDRYVSSVNPALNVFTLLKACLETTWKQLQVVPKPRPRFAFRLNVSQVQV